MAIKRLRIADVGIAFERIKVRKVTPAIGAEIEGVDLARGIDQATFDEIAQAFGDHLVLFFRDQNISPSDQVAFGRMFGELHRHPAAPHEAGMPELMIIATDENSVRANGEGWHSDVSCDDEPPLGSMLYIKECPETGGDTLFANMYAAYEALSEQMKLHLEGLRAVHDGEHVYRGLYANLGVADQPRYPRAEHPIVRTHPVTKRRALFVNSAFTTHIVDLPRDESDALLHFLFQHLAHPIFQCRFRWTPRTLAFWDNRCAQHMALWDYWPQRRSGNRVTIKGDRPR